MREPAALPQVFAGLRVSLALSFIVMFAAEMVNARNGLGQLIRIAEMLVEKVQIAYRDEASGQELNITDLNLKTGRLDGQTPGDVALSARIVGKNGDTAGACDATILR